MGGRRPRETNVPAPRGLGRVTDRLRPLPDFLIIGTQKGGTSSLHGYLAKHPDLSASTPMKEVHYFDTRHFGDLAWYRAHFQPRKPWARRPFAFESTPRYLFHPEAPARIAAVLPRVKMIAVLRDPTRRAISAYRMEVARGREDLPMMEALLAEEGRLAGHASRGDHDTRAIWRYAYKQRGHYAEQLERYFALFDREQLLVLRSEDMFADPISTGRTITGFLGVSDMPAEARFPHRRPGYPKGTAKLEQSAVTPEVEQYLTDYFAEHNRRLEQLLGRRMWPQPAG